MQSHAIGQGSKSFEPESAGTSGHNVEVIS